MAQHGAITNLLLNVMKKFANCSPKMVNLGELHTAQILQGSPHSTKYINKVYTYSLDNCPMTKYFIRFLMRVLKLRSPLLSWCFTFIGKMNLQIPVLARNVCTSTLCCEDGLKNLCLISHELLHQVLH